MGLRPAERAAWLVQAASSEAPLLRAIRCAVQVAPHGVRAAQRAFHAALVRVTLRGKDQGKW